MARLARSPQEVYARPRGRFAVESRAKVPPGRSATNQDRSVPANAPPTLERIGTAPRTRAPRDGPEHARVPRSAKARERPGVLVVHLPAHLSTAQATTSFFRTRSSKRMPCAISERAVPSSTGTRPAESASTTSHSITLRPRPGRRRPRARAPRPRGCTRIAVDRAYPPSGRRRWRRRALASATIRSTVAWSTSPRAGSS